jgi:hypothetical protein
LEQNNLGSAVSTLACDVKRDIVIFKKEENRAERECSTLRRKKIELRENVQKGLVLFPISYLGPDYVRIRMYLYYVSNYGTTQAVADLSIDPWEPWHPLGFQYILY